MNTQAVKKVGFQVKEQVTVQDNTKESATVKKEDAAAAQTVNQKSLPVKNNTHQVTPTHSVPDKRADTACVLTQQGREVEMNGNKQHRANVKATDQIKKEPTKPTADAKVNQREGGMMNGAVKGKGGALMSSHVTAEVSKQVSTVEEKAKGGSQVSVPVGHLSPPIIKLQPLDVKGTGSCDEVQSMEVR